MSDDIILPKYEEPNAFVADEDDVDNDVQEDEDDCEVVDCDDTLELNNDEVDETNLDNVKIEGDAWINVDIVPVEKIKCIVPKKLFKAIQDIENSVNKKFSRKNEFSIYIRGELGDDGILYVCEDYYIPKQRVGVASVDYLEDPQPYYNGCLHKHPDGCMSFSGVDKKYINSNFEFSLLYVKQKIHMGIINIKYIGNRRVQVPLDIQMEGTQFDDVNIDNITIELPRAKINAAAVPVIPTPPILPGFDNSLGIDIKPHVTQGPSMMDVYDYLADTI